MTFWHSLSLLKGYFDTETLHSYIHLTFCCLSVIELLELTEFFNLLFCSEMLSDACLGPMAFAA